MVFSFIYLVSFLKLISVWIRARVRVRISISCISAIKTLQIDFVFFKKTTIDYCSRWQRLLQTVSVLYERENCLADTVVIPPPPPPPPHPSSTAFFHTCAHKPRRSNNIPMHIHTYKIQNDKRAHTDTSTSSSAKTMEQPLQWTYIGSFL